MDIDTMSSGCVDHGNVAFSRFPRHHGTPVSNGRCQVIFLVRSRVVREIVHVWNYPARCFGGS